MNNLMRNPQGAIDFLWGDTVGKRLLIRGLCKILVVALLALLIHEGGACAMFGADADWEGVQKAFNDANTTLSQIRIDQKGSFEIVRPQKPTAGAAGSGTAPPASKPAPNLHTVKLCIFSTWVGRGDLEGLRCSNEVEVLEVLKRSQLHEVLGYDVGLVPVGSPSAPVAAIDPYKAFFKVEGWPSHVRISESLETMLRNVERLAFNDRDASDVSVKLCVGTREPADNDACGLMAEVRDRLTKAHASLDAQVDRIRIHSLFFGPFQYLTLAVFVYSLIECLGLWAMWLSPRPTLFELDAQGRIAEASVSALKKDTVERFRNARQQSIEDKMFYQALAAGPRIAKTAESTEGARAGLAESVDSYSEYLLNDAVSRQDALETLGDTMLKLAFMGTVYGISAALFSARGLDTADPIRKLLAKSEMYSGIGVGFGTTLVGIVCSIIAAQVRGFLGRTWVTRIGYAYDLTRNYGLIKIIDVAQGLPPQPPWPVKPEQARRWGWFEALGTLVMTVVVVLLVSAAIRHAV